MKDTLYTIPLTDAFNAEDECPFCFIHRRLEQDAISFTLGASYMEDDIRAQTDRLGFCKDHYKKLYDYGNRLGLAFILHTHYQKLEKDLDKMFGNLDTSSPSLFKRLKHATQTNTSESSLATSPLHEQLDSCYICERIERNFTRYMETFFYLLESNEEFKTLFLNSKGMCLEHFTALLELAPYRLKGETKTFFMNTSKQMLKENLKRLEEDLSWFIDKNDYRNNAAPWKTSQDAIPRGIQKLTGIYVQDEPFKKAH
ncbi:DUF6062 family protein [Niameybacter sp.]|uniref:DUF6062 family protein n=1 Tax=Niameybacter sp. TaxID=2033640 RepID=UPI002FC89C58